MIYFPKIARKKKVKAEEQIVQLQGFPLGENTAVPAAQLQQEELAACINLKINPSGGLETREAVVKHSTVAITTVHDIKSCSLSGSQYTLCTNASKVYYLLTSGSDITPTEIGSTEGLSNITPYNDAALICDGGYLKYCDSTSEIKIAYDAGTDGTMYDNYIGTNDGQVAVSAAGVGFSFISPAWTAGLTIPVTSVEFLVQATGASPSITADVVRVSDSVVMASKVYGINDIPSSAADYLEIVFNASDVTNELVPSIAYKCLLKGTDVDLSYTVVTSGGQMITAGSTTDTTKNPVMRLHPGLPPKADWAVVSGTRVWIYDPDRPGGLHYGNLTHLDVSTTDGGGWLGVIDEDLNSFKIGAAQDLYGKLYVYGTEEQQYLCRLEGTSPADFSLPLMFQKIWSTQRTLQNVNNDLISSSAAGVEALSGVQEYGDLRTDLVSDPVKNMLSSWVSSTTFAGYYAKDGQYWLYNASENYIHVCHTKSTAQMPGNKKRYPWARYTCPITPTCFSQVGDVFMIGSSDGFIYKLDPTETQDLTTTAISARWKSAYLILPFKTVDLVKAQLTASSISGSTMIITIQKNGLLETAALSKDIALSISDTLTLASVEDVVLADMEDVYVYAVAGRLYFDININCYSFQVECKDIAVLGTSVYIDGMLFKYRELEA